MDKPIAAYKGSESFVFVCYAHKDADDVYADLVELDRNDINVWYDEGISGGMSWRAEIAVAIQNAQKFIFFISEASLKSAHCLREVDYALNHDIDILPVYLEDCALPPELDLVLNRVQALFRKTDSKYFEHLLGALDEDSGLTALLPIRKKKGRRAWLPILVVAALLLAFLFWMNLGPPASDRPASPGMVQAPNAYDLYLDGMDLVERWDKDDNLEKAIGLFREATDLDPGFALAFARLADSQRIQYAITRDTSWLALATENVKEAVRLNPDLAPVQVVLGRIRASQGNLDLAFAALERALEIDPNDAAANQSMAKLYERQGKLQDAEDLFRKAVMLDPEDLLIRDSYANFLFRQGRFEDASEQWRTVIRYASDHFGALVNLGSALNEMGKVSEAITFYERAIEIKPSYMAYANLGTAYSRSGHYSKSVEVFKKALEIEDSDWLTWGNLAYTYSWMDGMEELAAETFEHAIQLAEEGRKQNPRDAFANSDLALYYVKTGQEELALQRAQTAITLSPDTGEILAAAAEVYELLGQRDKAIELVQKALDLGHPAQIIQRNPEFADLLEDERMKGSP